MAKKPQMPPAPECEKMGAIQEKSQAIDDLEAWFGEDS